MTGTVQTNSKFNPSFRHVICAVALATTSCTGGMTYVARTPAELSQELEIYIALARAQINPRDPGRSVCVAMMIGSGASFDPAEIRRISDLVPFSLNAPGTGPEVSTRTISSAELAQALPGAPLVQPCRSTQFLGGTRVQFSRDSAFVVASFNAPCGRGVYANRLERAGQEWRIVERYLVSDAAEPVCGDRNEVTEEEGYFLVT